MNSLLVLAEEFEPPLACIYGERANYIHEYHDLKPGLELRAAVLGRGCGKARVQSLAPSEVILTLELGSTPPPRLDCTLLVAVPRPQTVKKIVQLTAMCGLSRLVFFRADATQKSYLTSKSLKPAALLLETIKGLEQAGDCVAPHIDVHRSLKSAMSASDLDRSNLFKIVADARAENGHNSQTELKAHSSVLALGPEAGWSAGELANFQSAGFASLSLGPRILRVEVAAAVLLGHLGAFR